MTKSKKGNKAAKAVKSTQETKRVRKPLTPEQRKRKQERDRKYRAAKRKAAKAGKCSNALAPCKSPTSGIKCVGKCPNKNTKGCCHKHDKTCSNSKSLPQQVCPEVPGDPGARRRMVAGILANIGKTVMDLINVSIPAVGFDPRYIPCSKTGKSCGAITVEPGVMQERFRLADGRNIVVTTVDGEKADPLSKYIPMDPQVRFNLLLQRMGDEIAEIVSGRCGE